VHVQLKGLSPSPIGSDHIPRRRRVLGGDGFHNACDGFEGLRKIRYEYRIGTIVRRWIRYFVTDVTELKSRMSHPYPFRTDSFAYVQALHRLTATIDVHGASSDDEAHDISSLVQRRHLSLIVHLTMKIVFVLALTVTTASAFSSTSAFTGRGRLSLVTPSALGKFSSCDGILCLLISPLLQLF
jgi:hypothetical protein